MKASQIVPPHTAHELTYPYNVQSNTYPTLQSRMQTPIHGQGYASKGYAYPYESNIQTNHAYDQRNYGYSTNNRNSLRSQQYPQQSKTVYPNY